MSYLDLINRYWQEVEIKGWTPVETNIYFRLLDICNKSGWRNPFALPNPRAVALMAVTENTLAAGRDRLVMKGLIGFKKGSRRSEAPVYCFPEKIDGEWVFPDSFTSNIEAKQGVKPMAKQGVKPMAKPQAYNKTKIKKENILDDNNIILLTRTREETDLDRFDSLLQEIADGREQIWVDQMRKKHGIDDVVSFLPSFRDHVIANSKLHEVSDINGFKRYFNVAFRYFSKINPIELLGRYEKSALLESFKTYCNWVFNNAPNVSRELIPLTEEEFTKLKEAYGSDMIVKTILDLNNRKDLIPKYYSLFRTLKNWMEKDDKPR